MKYLTAGDLSSRLTAEVRALLGILGAHGDLEIEYQAIVTAVAEEIGGTEDEAEDRLTQYPLPATVTTQLQRSGLRAAKRFNRSSS